MKKVLLVLFIAIGFSGMAQAFGAKEASTPTAGGMPDQMTCQEVGVQKTKGKPFGSVIRCENAEVICHIVDNNASYNTGTNGISCQHKQNLTAP